MFNARYKIAGKVVDVTSVYQKVHDYCALYKTEELPDYYVRTTNDDIRFERERSLNEKIRCGQELYNSPDDYLEELAVYRKIAEKMPDYDTVLFHGSVIAVDGKAYLFTAKSGTGKSTHTALWRELLGERAVMVNDDKPLLQITDEGVIAYGTPYNGKHNLGNNINVPLKAICILTRSEENHIERITRTEAYSMLMQQMYRPLDKSKMIKSVMLLEKLAEKTELYRLGCNMDIEAAEVAYNGMKG